MIPVGFLSVHLRILIFMTIGKTAYDPNDTRVMVDCLAQTIQCVFACFNAFCLLIHLLYKTLVKLVN